MNKYTNISAAVAALVAASALQARPVTPPVTQTIIRLTGSTAFRAAVYNALVNHYFDSTPTTYVPTGTAGPSSSKITFAGTKTSQFGANQLVIEASYSGSVEGLVNVLGTTSSSPVPQPVFWTTGGTNDTVTAADLALVDVAQDTTQFTAAAKGAAYEFEADPVSYSGQGIGVVTFAFAVGRNATAAISNITANQYQVLAANGKLKQGFFNGLGAADTHNVYLTGRYPFSGTRVTVNAVTGLGANASTVLYAADGASLTGNGVAIPAGAVFNTATPPAAIWDAKSDKGGGYISGGTIATVLNNASQANIILGYLGLGDVRSASPSLADRMINYNRVAPTKANVENGTYDLWSYEHLYGKKSGPSTDVINFVNGTADTTPITSDGFINALDTAIAADIDYVSLTQMNSSRQNDGGVVSP